MVDSNGLSKEDLELMLLLPKLEPEEKRRLIEMAERYANGEVE